MRQKNKPLLDASGKVARGASAPTREPGRAGSIRLAILAVITAGIAGGAAFLATGRALEQSKQVHLVTLREAGHRSVQTAVKGFSRDAVDAAQRGNVADAYRSLRQGYIDAGRDAGSALATAWSDGGSSSKAVRAYKRAHETFHPALEGLRERLGWANLHLVDAARGKVVYSAIPEPGTFRSITDGALQASPLGRSIKNAKGAPTGSIVLEDGASTAPLYAAVPLSGSARGGLLVATLPQARLDQALLTGGDPTRFEQLGLGARGDVRILGADGMPRSASRGSGVSAAEGIQSAQLGEASAGTFRTDAGAVVGAYAPIDLGDQRWVIAAEVPLEEALAPMVPLGALLGALLLVAAVVGWVMGGRLWSQFGGRLRSVTSTLKRAQKGDRALRLDISEDGAIGDLAAVINRLLEDRGKALDAADAQEGRLTGEADQLADVIRRVASGDLTTQANANGCLTNVSAALNEMTSELGGLAQTIRTASSQVGESAGEIQIAAEESATGAATQAKELSGTVKSAKQIQSTTAALAESCGRAEDAARRSEQSTRLGNTAVQDVLSGMDNLHRETRASTVKIKRLGERSMQISAIIGTISKMSAQTDMLALNASIEASRAGEQGQGFTLVAEEVRKLAERAAAATKEIERLITGIQADVNEAVSGMERQAERVEVQTAAAEQAKEALDKVAQSIDEATSSVGEVCEAAQGQISTVEELGQTMTRVAEVARGVQKSSDHARKNTRALLGVAQELGSQAERFNA